eukprot:297637-Hanusia_phi.AAC.1
MQAPSAPIPERRGISISHSIFDQVLHSVQGHPSKTQPSKHFVHFGRVILVDTKSSHQSCAQAIKESRADAYADYLLVVTNALAHAALVCQVPCLLGAVVSFHILAAQGNGQRFRFYVEQALHDLGRCP